MPRQRIGSGLRQRDASVGRPGTTTTRGGGGTGHARSERYTCDGGYFLKLAELSPTGGLALCKGHAALLSRHKSLLSTSIFERGR